MNRETDYTRTHYREQDTHPVSDGSYNSNIYETSSLKRSQSVSPESEGRMSGRITFVTICCRLGRHRPLSLLRAFENRGVRRGEVGEGAIWNGKVPLTLPGKQLQKRAGWVWVCQCHRYL